MEDKFTPRQRQMMQIFVQEIQKELPTANPIALRGLMREAVELYEQGGVYKVKDLETVVDLQVRFKEFQKIGEFFAQLLVRDLDMDAAKTGAALQNVYSAYLIALQEETR